MPTPEPLAAVLFDLDGTLLDTAPDFVTVVNRLRLEQCMGPMDPDLIRATVSNGAGALVRLAFGYRREDAGFAPLHSRLLDLYEQHLAVDTALFPQLDRLLSELESLGIAWGVVTNKPARFTLPLLAALGLKPAVTICPEDVRRTKPDPEPLHLACERLGCPPAQAVYVGDHRRDIDAGTAAGMPTCAAGFGYVDPGEDPAHWGADVVAADVSALRDWLAPRLIG